MRSCVLSCRSRTKLFSGEAATRRTTAGSSSFRTTLKSSKLRRDHPGALRFRYPFHVSRPPKRHVDSASRFSLLATTVTHLARGDPNS